MPNLGQIRRFLELCDLDIWRMTLKNNRAPLLSNIKLYALFHHHMWIQTGVTVRKRLNWVVTSVNLTFDLWPWHFAWTSLLSLVITPDNFVMIRWWEHSQKGVTDRQTDRQTDERTDWTIHRAAWSQLKPYISNVPYQSTGTHTCPQAFMKNAQGLSNCAVVVMTSSHRTGREGSCQLEDFCCALVKEQHVWKRNISQGAHWKSLTSNIYSLRRISIKIFMINYGIPWASI